MFRVNLQQFYNEPDIELLIQFMFPHKHRKLRNQKKTVCIIKIKDKLNNKWFLLSSGVSTCNEADTYNKITGMKYALAHALRDTGYVKEIRAIIWTHFLDYVKIKKKSKSKQIPLPSTVDIV